MQIVTLNSLSLVNGNKSSLKTDFQYTIPTDDAGMEGKNIIADQERSVHKDGNPIDIPSHAMNYSLFPVTLCQEIKRASTHYFWGSTVEDRKCHWRIRRTHNTEG